MGEIVGWLIGLLTGVDLPWDLIVGRVKLIWKSHDQIGQYPWDWVKRQPPLAEHLQAASLVHRPHPFTRINGLVTQLEFVGLAENPIVKKHGYSNGDKCNNQRSRNFIGLPLIFVLGL